jgi:multicomponent Na+:H+ antiporter subunit G
VTTALAEICLVVGAALTLLAGIGVVRFPDTAARMHAGAKAPVLGMIMIAIGAVIQVGDWRIAAIIVLAIALQLIASPVGSQMLARSVYYRHRPEFDGPDELAGSPGADLTLAPRDEGERTEPHS